MNDFEQNALDALEKIDESYRWVFELGKAVQLQRELKFHEKLSSVMVCMNKLNGHTFKDILSILCERMEQVNREAEEWARHNKDLGKDVDNSLDKKPQ